jgi:tetratricopeptide (TPR) repeat protein
MRANDPANAVTFYRKAQQLIPNELAVTFNLANSLRLLGSMEEAREHFERATQMYEQTRTVQSIPAMRANAMQAMGLAYIALGNRDKAKQHLHGALEIAEKTATPVFSALVYREISPKEFQKEISDLLRPLESPEADTASNSPSRHSADPGEPERSTG